MKDLEPHAFSFGDRETINGPSLRQLLDGCPMALVVFQIPDLRYVGLNAAALRYAGPAEQQLGRPVLERHPEMRGSEYHRALLAAAADGEPRQLRRLRGPSGTFYDVEIRRLGAFLAVYFQDVTELASREAQQAAVAELGLQAIAGASIEALDQLACDVLRTALSLDLSFVLELTPDRTQIRPTTWAGRAAGAVRPISYPLNGSLGGLAILEKRPIVVPVFAEERRFVPPRMLLEAGVQSSVCVPVGRPERPFGALSAHSFKPRAFGQDDVHFLQTVANVLASRREQDEAAQALRRSEGLLAQAQRMEAVGQLAGGVAHDFNNLLTTIMGNTQLALEEVPEGQLRADLEEIERSTRRAAALTRRLLAVSRRQVMQPRLLDLAQVLRELAPGLTSLLGDQVALHLQPAPGLHLVRVDQAQLEQLIVDLAANARDAMAGRGSLSLELDTLEAGADQVAQQRVSKTGPHVRLRFTDTSPGLSAEGVQRAFEPFSSARGHGEGLGLATVYGIARQSGGGVWVESAPGRGACFHLLLPQAERDGSFQPAQPPPEAALRARASETVLLVEDEDGVRSVARRTLAQLGYTVLEACDGEDALAVRAAHAGAVDLVITDLVMPRMGGRQLSERLRAAGETARFLFISGYSGDEVLANDGVPAGTAFLEKPFSVDALLRKVREVLAA